VPYERKCNVYKEGSLGSWANAVAGIKIYDEKSLKSTTVRDDRVYKRISRKANRQHLPREGLLAEVDVPIQFAVADCSTELIS
jgi:hypothetical protein